MRSLVCDARNIRHCVVERDGETKIETLIEVVLTVMTRKMQFSGSGLVQTEDLESMRFETTISGAKRLVEDVKRWIEDAERENRKLTLMADDSNETPNPQLGLNALLRSGQYELPPSVATCPECGGKLEVDCNEWDSKTGIPTESGFHVSCVTEEEDLDAWLFNDDDERDSREVAHRHLQSDWQPVIDTVWKWIESQRPST